MPLLTNTDAKLLTTVFTNNPVLKSIQTYQTPGEPIKVILEILGWFNVMKSSK